MMHTVSTFDLKTLGLADMYGMYKLRYEVFAKKLGWDVETFNEMEKDHYDDLPRVSYVLAKTASDQVAACWRILPTTGPYMLKDTFPELLHGQPVAFPQFSRQILLSKSEWEKCKCKEPNTQLNSKKRQFAKLSTGGTLSSM